MKRLIPAALTCLALAVTTAAAEDAAPLRLERATTHPMAYYVSPPTGWTAQGRWPVVVVIPDAGRDFLGNAAAFVNARKDRPFLIVAPQVLTSGGAGFRGAPTYTYPAGFLEKVAPADEFRFDSDGIEAVVADVKKRYGGEEKYFLTGWEAGGHTVWAMLFQHPEALRAAAPVSTNYKGRWMSDASFSKAPERARLPVKVLFCGTVSPDMQVGWDAWLGQTKEAMRVAGAHGFENVSLTVVKGKPHGPLADEVLDAFGSLLAR